MIEETITGFGMPYREDLAVRAFTFGIDHDGHVLGEGAPTDDADRTSTSRTGSDGTIHARDDGTPTDDTGHAPGEEGPADSPANTPHDARLADLEPALCVVAGLRGNEVQQMLICARIVNRLAELEAAGALAPGKLVTVIPCANPASMAIGWRFWPGDKTDINRMFPGYDQGETTQRIAAALFERVKGFRYGIHLSSFHLEGDFLPHVRVMHGPGTTENHGADFGLPYVLHHVPGSFDTTTLHYNWRLWDTEAYTLYADETSQINEESADEIVRAILRFADARGIIRWPNHGGYRAEELGERGLAPVPIPAGGIFCPKVQVGSVVREGQLLGEVIDPLRGSVKARLLAPTTGAVFYAARTPLVNEGALAFQLAPPDASATVDTHARGNFLDPEA